MQDEYPALNFQKVESGYVSEHCFRTLVGGHIKEGFEGRFNLNINGSLK